MRAQYWPHLSTLLMVSLMDMDMSSSWDNFCFPNATAPLVTMMHSAPAA